MKFKVFRTSKFKPGSRVLVIDQSSMHFSQVGWIVGTYREYWEPNASFKYWVTFDGSPTPGIIYSFDEDQLAVKENLK